MLHSEIGDQFSRLLLCLWLQFNRDEMQDANGCRKKEREKKIRVDIVSKTSILADVC